MLNGLSIQDSWKTITLVPDFMQEVISLSDFKDTLKQIVKCCELQTNDDKDLLLYTLLCYTMRAYKAKVEDDFIINNKDIIVDYFGQLINHYNELTESNYNELHKEIWYYSVYKSAVEESTLEETISKITMHELFDDCEIKHKSSLLNQHISILLHTESSDFDTLIELNTRLKAINKYVRSLNGEEE